MRLPCQQADLPESVCVHILLTVVPLFRGHPCRRCWKFLLFPHFHFFFSFVLFTCYPREPRWYKVPIERERKGERNLFPFFLNLRWYSINRGVRTNFLNDSRESQNSRKIVAKIFFSNFRVASSSVGILCRAANSSGGVWIAGGSCSTACQQGYVFVVFIHDR